MKMKKLTITLLLFASCLLIACNQSKVNNQKILSQINELIDNDEVFEARRIFESSIKDLPLLDSLIYSSILNNSFNAHAYSNTSLDRLFKHFAKDLDTNTKCDLLKIKLQNHVKLFEYKNAYDIASDLVNNYSTILDSTENADFNNQVNLWKGLSNQPPQIVHKKQYSVIDLVDGSRIPSFINNSDSVIDLTLDSGANLSVIISSLADSFGLKRLEAFVDIKGIHGNDVAAQIALADSIKFGNVKINNVAFIVFPDSALYFPHVDFQIYGILGYPVISELQEIQLTKDNKLIIPETSTNSSYSNLALNYLTPVIELLSDGDTLLFTFDTGASNTWLYDKYFKKHEERIKKDYKLTKLNLGGAGGVVSQNVYKIKFPIKIGNQSVTLESAVLFPEKGQNVHNQYSGNLGLDAIKSFDKVTINFRDMFVQFSMK